jgi:glucosamine--fructose-6-phosphate aminotransferase (isomerizing)
LAGASLFNENAVAIAVPGGEVCMSPLQIPNISFDVIIPISRSGQTTETIRATEFMKKKNPKAKIVGITCAEKSSISDLSDICLVSKGGVEDSVIMTKSFSSMLVILQYLFELKKESKVKLNFQSLSENSRKIIERYEKTMKDIGYRNDLNKFIFLGTGEYFGLAMEAMLKMKEMALSWSEAYNSLEFRHGPKSIVDDETFVTFLWPNRGIDEHEALLKEVSDLRAKTLVIGANKSLRGVKADYIVEIPSHHYNLVLYMPLVQLLGYYRAVSLGLNPDRPKNLEKFVKI